MPDTNEHGIPKDEDSKTPAMPSDPVTVKSPITISKTDDEDTLVNVHVNNPLKKLMKLLESIKKQKAFSFTLKGSLGIAGIALVVTTFGIFGGTKAFCGKGIQSYMGTLHVLEYPKSTQPDVPLLDRIREFVLGEKIHIGNRIVLIKRDTGIVQLKGMLLDDARVMTGQNMIVTGEYDQCAQSLSISDVDAVELYP